MFVLRKCCICFYLQVLINLGAPCFSRTEKLHPHCPCTAGSDKSHSTQGEANSGDSFCLGTVPETALGMEGWIKYAFCWWSFRKVWAQFSAAWIREQLLALRGLYQLLIRDGCKEFKFRILRNPGALFRYYSYYSINQKNLHCDFKLFKALSSAYPVAFVQFGLAPAIFLWRSRS